MIDEKDDKVVASFHCCIMIETNMTSMNWKSDPSDCLNDCFFWIIFNHWTYLFNQLQGRASRSWRIQNVIELNCEVFEKSDPKERWRIKLRRFFTKKRRVKMRNTFIQKTSLWYIIKRTYEDEDWITTISLFRTWKNRGRRRDFAKVYFFENDALSALMIARIWWKSGQ